MNVPVPIPIDFKAIGLRIKDVRREAGLTQQQLGEAAGYSTAYIANIERGKGRSASVVVLYNIALALEVCLDYLLGMPVMTDAADSKFRGYLMDCTPQQKKFLVDTLDDLYDNMKNTWG